MSRKPRKSTKERILDTAQKLFAKHGLEGTSLRQITSEAKVNLAAVNYHYGSKEGLIEAAFELRVKPINERRLEMLSNYEAELNGAKPDARRLIELFIEPAYLTPSGGIADDPLLLQLIGRLYQEAADQMRARFRREYGEVVERFLRAFSNALPELSREELLWRMHFMVGMLAHTLLSTESFETFTDGLCKTREYEKVVKRLVDYSEAGFIK